MMWIHLECLDDAIFELPPRSTVSVANTAYLSGITSIFKSILLSMSAIIRNVFVLSSNLFCSSLQTGIYSANSISQQSTFSPSNISCSGSDLMILNPAFSYALIALLLSWCGSRRTRSAAILSFRWEAIIFKKDEPIPLLQYFGSPIN